MEFDWSSARPLEEEEEEDFIPLEEELEEKRQELEEQKEEQEFDWESAVAREASSREDIMAELDDDPDTRMLAYQMLDTEGGGVATMEALVNRTAMIRQKIPDWTIGKELNSGFYGPINRGYAQTLNLDPKTMARYQQDIDEVRAGSNVIQGRTDQGSLKDPNVHGPGRVHIPSNPNEVYNYWTGRRNGIEFSHGDSAAFAAQMEDTSRPSTTRTAKAGEKYQEFDWASAKPVEEAQVAEFDWASAKPVEAGQLKEEKGGTPQNVKGPENRERLLTAISGAEKAGYTVPHFIGTKDEPEGDRAPTRDMEQLVGALAKMEENAIRAEDREGATKIGEARAYWEEQIKTAGMTAEQWKKQTGEEDPRYPHEPAFTAKQSPEELIESVDTAITAGQGTWETAKTELAKVGGAIKTSVQSAGLGLGETINRYAYSPIVHGLREAIDFIAPDSDLAKHAAKFDDAFYKNTVEIPAEQRRKLQAGAIQAGAASEVAFTTGQMIGDLPTIMLTSGILPELKTGIQLINAMRHGAAAMTVPAMRAGADAAEESKKKGGDALEQLGAFIKATTITMGMGAVPMATTSGAPTMVGRFGERAAKSVPLASATAEGARLTENLLSSVFGGEQRPFSLEENIKATIPMAVLGGVAGRDTRPSKFERTYGFNERNLDKAEWMRGQMLAEGLAKATPEKVMEWEAKWKAQEGQWPEEAPVAPEAKVEPAKPEAAAPPEKPTLPRKVHDFLRPKLGIVESPKATKGFEMAKEEANSIADYLNKASHWSPWSSALGNWVASDQKAYDNAVMNQREAWLKAAPDAEARKGMTMHREAGGDIKKLAGWGANVSQADAKAAYRAAGALKPNELAVMNAGIKRLEEMRMLLNANGIDVAERENYITHMLHTSGVQAGSTSPLRSVSSFFRYAKARTYDNFFQAFKAGEKPKTLDFVDIVTAYELNAMRAINKKRFVDRLKYGQARDGRNILAPSSIRNTPEGEGYQKLPAPGLEGLVVHPDHYKDLKKILEPSRIQEWLDERTRNPFLNIAKGVLSTALEAQKYGKGTMFSLSFFHQGTEGLHGFGHRVNSFDVNTRKIDLNDPKQYDAAVHGLMLRPDQISQEHFMEGIGSDSYNIVTIMSRKFGGDAGKAVAELIDGYSRYLFESYIPRLKFDTYEHIVARNTARFAKELKAGDVSMSDIKSLSADQANAAYGHLNYKKMARSATVRQAMQIILLAPDFFEARARFAGQAAKGLASKQGTEQLIALSLLGVGQYFTARILNSIDHGDAEWDPEHAFQVKTDLGGFLPDKRWLGLRSVPEDIHKFATDWGQFTANRLSPFARLGFENIFKTDWKGNRTDFEKSVRDMISNVVPLPMQGVTGPLLRPDQAKSISWWETLLKSTGVQIHRVSPINDAFAMAEDWNKKNDRETYDRNQASRYPESKYRKLRYALEDSDWEGAKAEAEKLGEGRKIGENFQQSTLRPFTGSMAHDRLMYEELSDHDKKIFDAAIERRLMILARYREQIGPTGKTRVTKASLHKKMREAKLREMKEALKVAR